MGAADMAGPRAVPEPTVEVLLAGTEVATLAAIAPPEQWGQWCGQWLQQLGEARSPIGAYEVGLQLVTDGEIQTLNRDYRDKDTATDVLAFAALETDMVLPSALLHSDPLYLGDIIISLDTARRQSGDHHHTWQEEVLWLTAHGFLHLLGWDHPDEAALHRMWQQQQQLLESLGITLTASAYRQDAG